MTSTLTAPYEVICEDTSKLTRPEWLRLRKQGLGSSDIAPALGMSPWTSAYALYCDKRDLVPEPEQSEFYEWKLRLETPILDWVEEKGWTGPLRRHLMLRSVQHPFLLANPDGLGDELVEVKTAHSMDEKRWDNGVPEHYVYQAVSLMAVTGHERCIFAVAFGTEAPRKLIVEWDPIKADEMIQRAGQFWDDMENGIEPDPDGSEATMSALRQRYMEVDRGEAVQLASDVLDLTRKAESYAQAIKNLTAAREGVKAQLMAQMGEAEVGQVGDLTVCTWNKSDKTGKRTFLFKEIEEVAS